MSKQIYSVGDAKKYQGVSVKTNPFFICGENLPHTLPHRFANSLGTKVAVREEKFT